MPFLPNTYMHDSQITPVEFCSRSIRSRSDDDDDDADRLPLIANWRQRVNAIESGADVVGFFNALRLWIEVGSHEAHDPYLDALAPLFLKFRPSADDIIDNCSHHDCCAMNVGDDRWQLEAAAFDAIATRFASSSRF